MASFMDYLKQYEQAFQAAEVKETTSFDELPDGKYQVRVDRVELTESKASGRPQMVWEFVVVGGKYSGRRVWKYNALDSAERIEWLKNDLWTAGLKLERLVDLESSLHQLLDQCLEINLKTKKTAQGTDIQNVYINKPVDLGGQPNNNTFNKKNDPFADDGKPINISDDDLPF